MKLGLDVDEESGEDRGMGSFTYLGSIISKNNGCRKGVKRRSQGEQYPLQLKTLQEQEDDL